MAMISRHPCRVVVLVSGWAASAVAQVVVSDVCIETTSLQELQARGAVSCSDLAPFCNDATHGAYIQNVCPRTCQQCPPGGLDVGSEQNSGNSNDNNDSSGMPLQAALILVLVTGILVVVGIGYAGSILLQKRIQNRKKADSSVGDPEGFEAEWDDFLFEEPTQPRPSAVKRDATFVAKPRPSTVPEESEAAFSMFSKDTRVTVGDQKDFPENEPAPVVPTPTPTVPPVVVQPDKADLVKAEQAILEIPPLPPPRPSLKGIQSPMRERPAPPSLKAMPPLSNGRDGEISVANAAPLTVVIEDAPPTPTTANSTSESNSIHPEPQAARGSTKNLWRPSMPLPVEVTAAPADPPAGDEHGATSDESDSESSCSESDDDDFRGEVVQLQLLQPTDLQQSSSTDEPDSLPDNGPSMGGSAKRLLLEDHTELAPGQLVQSVGPSLLPVLKSKPAQSPLSQEQKPKRRWPIPVLKRNDADGPKASPPRREVLERQRSAADILRTYPELLESPKSFEVTMADDFLGVDYSLYAPSDDFTARVVYDWSDKMYPSETWHLAQFVTRMKAEEAARKAGHDGEYDNIDGYVDTQITDTQ